MSVGRKTTHAGAAFQLREVDRAKLYTSIVDQILDGVHSMAFPVGEALPPERLLAEQLGVSRSSVREAIRVLEHAGVLDVRTGSGTYVARNALSKTASLRAHAALIGEESPLDVMVARRALEPVCAELAASNHTRQDVRILRATIDGQAKKLAHSEDPSASDLAFHAAVASASHNHVLESLVERLVTAMGQSTWRSMKHRALENPRRARGYLFQHKEILVAISASDSVVAGDAMLRHLDSVEDGLLEELD